MSDSNNGIAVGLPPVSAVINPVVQLLEQALAAAKAGQIDTVGLVIISGRGDIQPLWAGGRLGDLHTGAGMIQWRIMAQINQPAQQSRILRPMG